MHRPSLKLSRELDAPGTKRAYNQRLFTEVAPCYDRITRVLSFNRDAAWKREMIRMLPDLPAPHCLDVACGTGDLAGLLRSRYPEGHITGTDLTPSMLEIARARFGAAGVLFCEGDMGQLAAPDASIDVMTGGYALRNAPDLPRFLREVARVLKPGGVAAFLDFSRPDIAWLARAQGALLRLWGGLWGWVYHRDRHVYGYIAHSLAAYPARSDLHRLFEASHLRLDRAATRFLGVVEIIIARRADGPAA